MNAIKTPSALVAVVCGTLFGQAALADVTIPYNEYSGSPTIGRGNGTSTDPKSPGYGAMRIFIEKVRDYTDEHGPDALPVGQKVIFQPNQDTDRAVNALRAGIQFANSNAIPKPVFSEPSWGFIYNSVPLGMNFEQTLGFLYTPGAGGRDGITLAQSVLEAAAVPKSSSRSWEARCRGRDIFRARSAGRSVTREMLNARRRLVALAWRASAPPAGGFATCRRPRTS